MVQPKLVVQNVGVLRLDEVESHRVEGVLFCEYVCQSNAELTYAQFRIVLGGSEYTPTLDFRKLSVTELENRLFLRLKEVVTAMEV
jgi:hypothetical protein